VERAAGEKEREREKKKEEDIRLAGLHAYLLILCLVFR